MQIDYQAIMNNRNRMFPFAVNRMVKEALDSALN
jgi:hypothetical protein